MFCHNWPQAYGVYKSTYRKVVYTNRGLFAILKLFWCGFYSSAAFMRGRLIQCSESAKLLKAVLVWHNAACAVKAKVDFVNVAKLFQNVKTKTLGMQNAVKFSSMNNIGPPFSSHGFCLKAANVKLQLLESAASNQVRLLTKCGFYTRLHGLACVPVTMYSCFLETD